VNNASITKMPSTTITTTSTVIGQQSPLSSPTSSSYDSDLESPLASPSESFHQSKSGSNYFIMYKPFPPTVTNIMMADKPIYRIPDYTQQPTTAYFNQEQSYKYGINNSSRNSINQQYIL
jgi:hypothetical protein